MVWNSWLTYHTIHEEQLEQAEPTPNPDTLVFNHTINGYTTDLTETVSKTQPKLVSVSAQFEDRTMSGSGMIYRSNDRGTYILTSNSLVQEATEIEVRFDSGIALEGELVGGDLKTDIALLVVHPEFEAEPIVLGDSDVVKQGEYVISMGGRNVSTGSSTVGFGVVSSPAQLQYEFAEGETAWIANAFLTDIYSTEANAGGALVNLNGDMIGLITRRTMSGETASRLTSAITSNEVSIVANQLLETGEVKRAYFGIVGRNIQDMQIYEKSAYAIPLDIIDGILVTQVYPESPAAEAGIQFGDVITQINDMEIHTMHDYQNATYALEPEAEVIVTLIRNASNESMTVEVK